MAKTKIHGEYLDPSVISGQTQVTAVGADSMLIFDATDNALKKALLSDLIETVGSTPTFSSVAVDNITIDGTEIDLSSGSLTLDVASETIIDSGSSGILRLKHSATDYGMFFHDSNHMYMQSNISDGDIIFRGKDGGSTIAALTLDMSNAGAATFNAGVTATTGTFSGAVSASSVDASAGFLNGSNGGIRIHSGGTKFFNITAANAARDNHMDIGASDARFKGLYLGDKIFIGGMTLTSNDAGRIGLNRNPDDGTSVNSSSLQRYQINGPYSGGDYLQFQNYDSSGNYTGGFRVDDGAIRAAPLGVSTPSYSFDNDTDTGMTRPTGDTLQFVCGGTVKLRVSGDGLLFNSDTAAANALDDFERGTYTATITCASGSITLYSGYDTLAYTKIGRIVHVQGKLTVNTQSSPSGATTINLPFTINNLNDRAGFCTHIGLGYFNGSAISTGFHSIYMEGVEGTAYIRPYVMKPSTTAGNAPSTNNLGDNMMAQGSDVYINFTYIAA